MTFHKEGNKIIFWAFIILAALNACVYFLLGAFPMVFSSLMVISLVLFILVVQFFRVPKRTTVSGPQDIVCPADGKVVAIEEVFESEFVNEKRIQVSVFMSPLNVHVNWYPIHGVVKYFKYHPGLYLVAWHPKSSTENERSTVVVENENGKTVLFRQIAGAVARRIVCYAKAGDKAEPGKEFGFIKFGSRIDLLLPLDTDIKVKIDDKVVGAETILGTLR